MATTKAPLFGLDASGTLANAIVFSKWRGRTYVRRHTTPANPKSGLQVGMRSVFKFLTQAYAALTAAQKLTWTDAGAADNITSLNAMVREGQGRMRRHVGCRRATDEALETTIDPPTSPAAAAAPTALVLSWTRPVANQGDWYWALYRGLTTGFSTGIANLVAMGAVADNSYVDTKLTTGTAYFYKVREGGGGGKLGTLSAEFTGTPT